MTPFSERQTPIYIHATLQPQQISLTASTRCDHVTPCIAHQHVDTLYYFSVGFLPSGTGEQKESVPKGEEAGRRTQQSTDSGDGARRFTNHPYFFLSLFYITWLRIGGSKRTNDTSRLLFFFLSLVFPALVFI